MQEGFDFSADDARGAGAFPRLALLGVLTAFLLGIALTWYLMRGDGPGLGSLFSVRTNSETAALADVPPDEGADETVPAARASPSAEVAVVEARQAVQKAEEVAEQTGGIDSRVAALEQRLTRLDLQSQAAAGNAARAEGLLIAFAARRALERGAPLGYLEDQLILRFGDARPNAVQTVIDASTDLVTLDQLMTRLEGLAPELTEPPADEGLLGRIGNEIAQLFAIRSDDTPSPVAERRLDRARVYLETGRVEAAVTEVRNMPNSAAAEEWIGQAERYAAAQRALEALELAAILEPRELRDASGTRVEQPSLAPDSQGTE
jgi:hypothetical protein